MSRIVLIDGNSIMNRAFYGIMGSKMLTTPDGKYTNAVYGFLAIMFKIIDDLKPEYIMVTFDLKAPTARHLMYDGYKANRKGMPNELAEQMPLIKEILGLMNIAVIEKEGYEADDVLGTISKRAEKEGFDVTILSGDRDTFQLATDKITIRIPRTKAGKTEEEDFDKNKVIETYGITPVQLIELKGLMGDSSDNIPGVPGVGEKTALTLIKEHGTISNLYKKLKEDDSILKGKLKEKIEQNEELAQLSRTLGTINIDVPIEEKIEDLKVIPWDKQKVLEKFKELKFNRFIERFDLKEDKKDKEYKEEKIEIDEVKNIKELIAKVEKEKEINYFFEKVEDKNDTKIINKRIKSIYIYIQSENKIYYIYVPCNKEKEILEEIKEIFENKEIQKNSYKIREDFVILKTMGIQMQNINFDAEIAAYVLNPSVSKYPLEEIAKDYLDIEISKEESKKENVQLSLFEQETNEDSEEEKNIHAKKVRVIANLKTKMLEEIKNNEELDLFKNIEMPLIEVLGTMQYNGMHVEKQELIEFGDKLKENLEGIKKEIYQLANKEFNINSTQQLGIVLFEELGLPVVKKNKSGYSTDVDVLNKIEGIHPIIEKILKYRGLTKLNSTYVEGMIPYINEKTSRIHSTFHQTVTATGRISSSDPNLQNIPTRVDLGKQLRKVFKPKKGYVFVDADYSQIELRVLAHISNDDNMVQAFTNDEDIHRQVASKVFNIPFEDVSKEQRSRAKAVNFGIVYGISDFGLAEQLKIKRKDAKEYIEQYLEKYNGISKFMDDVVEEAKAKGYVETIFKRRRYVPELKSNNYMVRQLGSRIAMNTPIQGTAADIMKIAMINVYKKIKEEKIDARIVLQVHDELMLEVEENDVENAEKLLKNCMEDAIKLIIPLKVEVSTANSWYEAK